MVVALEEYNLGMLVFLPFVVGTFAVITRWAAGPALVVITLVIIMMTRSRISARGVLEFDLLLSASLMLYVIGQFRLQGLARGLFAEEARDKSPWKLKDEPVIRYARTPPPGEALWVAVAAAVWAGLGFILWTALARLTRPTGLFVSEGERKIARIVFVCWLGGMLLALAAAGLGYLSRRRASPEESLLYLQDQLWRETRHEQDVLNRWLVWRRLRAQRRREK
jgi:hypothetical protein